jgi:hypothetical protein
MSPRVAWKLATTITDLEVSAALQGSAEVKQGLETVMGNLRTLL